MLGRSQHDQLAATKTKENQSLLKNNANKYLQPYENNFKIANTRIKIEDSPEEVDFEEPKQKNAEMLVLQ